MESSNVHSALASLEERFHELRILGEQRLHENEKTIIDLQQHLADAIIKQQNAEAKLQASEEALARQTDSCARDLDEMHQKLQQRNEELEHLRIRCEMLLQQAIRTERLELEVQSLKQHLEQITIEDEQVYSQLNQSIDEQRELLSEIKDLKESLDSANFLHVKFQEGLSKAYCIISRFVCIVG